MEGIAFTLPLGFTDDKGHLQRKGMMRLATAGDELRIQNHDQNRFNHRYRDLLLLSQVITLLGDKTEVTPEDLMELYEADFLYLQLLYKDLNGDIEKKAQVQCPSCGQVDTIMIPDLFSGMDFSSEDVKA
ncbi:hypothetical protein [Spirochaeta cellobiosiphila]|uniref:hypothetical protein n=1 Tax=Spirochaeta cellobiosiphila TaxID=504483 RepID=UPI00040071D0|nr:hypothetical protein [Spirochaeta cellobiosiphila]